MKFKIIFMVLVCVNTFLNALTIDQTSKIKRAYDIGSKITCDDGMTIGFTLASIMGQESSFGVDNLGDKYDTTGRLKSLYDSSLGNFQIRLKTAKRVIKYYPFLYDKYGFMLNDDETVYKKYETHYKKMLYFESIIKSKKWNKRLANGEIKAIQTIKWAKNKYAYHAQLVKLYKNEAKKDTMLINNLMFNFDFAAVISGYYFKLNYDEALKRFNFKETYWRSVGRYNGGWSNRVYYKKVIKRMKIVKQVIRSASAIN